MKPGQPGTDFKMRTRALQHLFADCRGSVLTFVAFALPVLVGFVGLGLDLSSWFAAKRNIQGMADAAAIGATYTYIADDMFQSDNADDAKLLASGKLEAERNGYKDCTTGNCIAVGRFPDGTFSGGGMTQHLVEVSLRQPAPLYFVSYFMDDVFIAARAAAGIRRLGTFCVISLSENAAKAVEFSGTTVADLGCGVVANSSAENAIYIGGTAKLVADPAQAYGGIGIGNNATLESTYPPLPYSPRVDDPFEDLVMPAKPATCDYSPPMPNQPAIKLVNSDPPLTIGPSVSGGSVLICGDVDISGSTLTLEAGTYFVDSGSFKITSDGNLDGSAGVTIILTADDPADVGTFDIAGTGTVELQSSEDTLVPGVVLMTDPDAAPSGNPINKLTGGSGMSIEGAVYIPTMPVDFSGGTSSSDGCLQLVAETVTFIGNSYIEFDEASCQNIGVALPSINGSQFQVVLVE